MRIGIYGGSFNPVHYGHVNVARTALDDLSLDRLIVMPAHISPFKTDAASEVARHDVPWDRLAGVQNAFAGMERVVIDEREIRRGGVSYAIDTVREIAAENPGAELFFIIGEDSVEGLPRWKDIDDLRRLVTFKAYPRTKESSTEIRELFKANGVVLNPDAKMVATVREGLRRKQGFCPCRLPKLPEFFCPCDEFKAQLRDPAFHGLCHCRLYLKP
jgi:nicotinate (nicotinamide) nucleotide adenylyltransferase